MPLYLLRGSSFRASWTPRIVSVQRFRGSVSRAASASAYGRTGASARRRGNSVTLVLTRYARAHQSGCRQSRRRRWHCPRTRTCRAWSNVRQSQWIVARTARNVTSVTLHTLSTLARPDGWAVLRAPPYGPGRNDRPWPAVPAVTGRDSRGRQ